MTGKSYISLVVSGEYEWYDKNEPNVLRGVYMDNYLTLCTLPPIDVDNVDPYAGHDFTL